MSDSQIHLQANRIGTPGIKWAAAEKAAWLAKQKIQRSYQDKVVVSLEPLKEDFDLVQYGELNYEANTYPLFIIKTRQWDNKKPTILITGGVHGYETSGVHGALAFAGQHALSYSDKFNILVAPCISPWGYETINRWNPDAVDPNRSFYSNSPAQESAALMRYMASLKIDITAHIDLHETTDTDNTQFRPALAARDGSEHTNWNIPDGFYLVGDTEQQATEFQYDIIQAVKKVTHIAPPDSEGKLIGVPLSQEGVVNYDTKKLGLCAGFTNAVYVTTTEVYPDSPKVTDQICINAQVAAIIGALEHIIKAS